MPDVPVLIAMVRTAALVALLVITAWTDFRQRRILNKHLVVGLIVAMVTAGLLQWLRDDATCWIAITGAACGLCAGFFLFWMGGIGAGDAKLLATIGAFGAPELVLWTLTRGAMVGFVMAVVHLIRHGGWRVAMNGFFGSHREERREEIAQPHSARTIPFGIALAAGALWEIFART